MSLYVSELEIVYTGSCIHLISSYVVGDICTDNLQSHIYH